MATHDALPSEEELQRRRKCFDAFFGPVDKRATSHEPILLPSGEWYACPCCGYPTIGERGSYDICSLCGWEDDGQDDPYADEVWGGPNGNYSLTEARRNFQRYLHQYRVPEGIWGTRYDNAAAMLIKREMMTLYESLATAEGAEAIQMEKQIEEKERLLDRCWKDLP